MRRQAAARGIRDAPALVAMRRVPRHALVPSDLRAHAHEDRPLVETARADLARLGHAKVHVRAGDGYVGLPEAAPFDAVMVTCAPDLVPEPLVRQVMEAGRMVIPVGDDGMPQIHLPREHEGEVVQREILPVRFVPMAGRAPSGEPGGGDGDSPVADRTRSGGQAFGRCPNARHHRRTGP